MKSFFVTPLKNGVQHGGLPPLFINVRFRRTLDTGFRRYDILILCSIFIFLVTSVVQAKEKKKEAELVVPEKECQYLISYETPKGVEYESGVDVHGKPVMEADITPTVVKPPEKYSFDISVDVAKYIGLTTPQGVLGEAKMGTVTVEKGRVAFNGNPLEGDAEAALKALCADQKAKKETPK